VQEGISNAMRHGHPDLIRIDIRSDRERLDVAVEDNGGGIQGAAGETVSLGRAGLTGMRERVLGLKGELHVVNFPGRGVRLSAGFPLAREHEAA